MARQKGLRTGRCQGCNHPERVRVERLLAAGASIQGAARKFAIDYHALRRDKRHSGGPPWFCHGPISRGHHPTPQAAVFKAVSYMDAIRGLAMTGRKRAGGEKKATTIVANHPDDLKGVLKQIGGSRSDHWNHVLASQAIQTLWLKHSDKESCDQQYSATVAALIGIGPRDELEAMMLSSRPV